MAEQLPVESFAAGMTWRRACLQGRRTGPATAGRGASAAVAVSLAIAACVVAAPALAQINGASALADLLPRTALAISSAPALPPEPPPPEGASATAAEGPLRITAVAVEGASVYSAVTLAPLTEGLTGAAVPAARIEAARQAILRRYRDDDYALVTVAAAMSDVGQLRFTVTEGYVADVRLEGDIGPAAAQVQRFLSHLTNRRPLERAMLERYLLLAQDIPGVTLRATLVAAGDSPGALTLVAHISRQAVAGLLTFDNRASPQVGPIEGLAVLDLNSFTSLGERTRVSLYHTFPNSENFGHAATEFYVGGSGLQIRLYGGAGPANPAGGVQQQFGTASFTTVFGGQVLYPLIRQRQQTLNVSAMLDANDSRIENVLAPGATESDERYDAVRALRLGADYAWSDRWAGADRQAVSLFAVRFSQGLPFLGASNNPNSSDVARPGEQSDFTKISFEIDRTQPLAQLSASTSLSLAGLFAGQRSNAILPPVEQFYLGGGRLARGYYLGQVTGDSALAVTVELQLNTICERTLFGTSLPVKMQFYGFYDWGETWQNVTQDQNTRLASTGGGVRVKVTQYTEFDLEAVARLNTHPSGQTTSPAGAYWRLLTWF